MSIDAQFNPEHFSQAWTTINSLRGTGKDAPLWSKSMIIETWDDDEEGMLLVSVARGLTSWSYVGPRSNKWPDGDLPDAQYLVLDHEDSLANFAKKVRDSGHDVSFTIEKLTDVDPAGRPLVEFDWWTITARSDTSAVEVRAMRYETQVDWRSMVNLAAILDDIAPAVGVPNVSYSRSLLKQIAGIVCASIEIAVAAPGRPAIVRWEGSDGHQVARGVAYAQTLRAPAGTLDDRATRALREAEKFLEKMNPPADDDEADPDEAEEAPKLALVPDADDDFDWGDDDEIVPDGEPGSEAGDPE